MNRKTFKDLSEAEFKEILLTFMVGVFVRAGVAETEGEDWQKIENQLDFFLDLAEELGFTDLMEYFEKHRIPSEDLNKEEERIMGLFVEDEFWEEVKVRLGQRDFFESLSKEEKERLFKEKPFWLPDKINEFYDKYIKEFEKYGIERLKIASSRRS